MRDVCRRLVWLIAPAVAAAQSPAETARILDRLNRLEEQNRALLDEVRALRQEVLAANGRAAAPPPSQPEAAAPLEERVAVVERRTEELAQSKVESSQKMPLAITGMALFNAFWNTAAGTDQQYPTTAPPGAATANAGGTLRQTNIGLRFTGPKVLGGGQVSGELNMDLFAGSGQSLNHLLRLRTGAIQIEWKNTTVLAGQEKPLISLREPNSLAQVGFSPLTNAGNPWLWQPQVRVERRIALSDTTGIRAQGALFQTAESSTTADPEYSASVAPARPGWEGRFEVWHDLGHDRRIAVAPGYHFSNTHVLGTSVPSRVFAVDWLFQPFARLEFSGLFFTGENIAVLGSLRQGIAFGSGSVNPVHGSGGWAQLSIRATRRMTFNLYGGEQDDRNRDLFAGAVDRNRELAANVIYRLGTNVLASVEISNLRTLYLGPGLRINTHYDLALAYLF